MDENLSICELRDSQAGAVRNMTYGRWAVIGMTREKHSGAFIEIAKCVCQCGEVRKVRHSELKRGKSKSCGCLGRELASARKMGKATVHGGMVNKTICPEYQSWRGMMARCYDVQSHAYKNYGGRGIAVCKRWHKFAPFLEDMGKRPFGCTLDRVNVNGDYEPSNCRWATPSQQASNTRKAIVERQHIGNVFGMLEVIEMLPAVNNKTMCRCRCKCGAEVIVRLNNLKSGGSSSCGCKRQRNQKKTIQKKRVTV